MISSMNLQVGKIKQIQRGRINGVKQGEEALINEEIIDVTIGTTMFHGDDKGGIPTLGGRGCNGKTMEYVDQEPEVARKAFA